MPRHNPANKYYFDNPEIWEEISKGRFKREPPFLQQIFKRHGTVKHILDVGCGTGSHLNTLTEMGFTGLGIDLNEYMIAFAKEKYPYLHFEVQDMKQLSYTNQFDAIICLCTTFCYNTTNEEVVAALQSFYKALKKDGILIIETFNPIVFLEKVKFESTIEKAKNYEKFGLRSVSKQWVDETEQQLIERRTVYKLEDKQEVKSDLTTYRLFFPQEMRYFLASNGFKFQDFYGNYDLEDKQVDKFRLITVSKK